MIPHSEQFLNTGKIIQGLDIRPGMHIADFGSGSGYFTVLLAEKVGPEGIVTALDVQEEPLQSVQEKAKAAGMDNIKAVRANLEIVGSSKLSDQSQDIVLLANILFQSSKKKEIMREAHRVLKDHGVLIVIDWKKDAEGFGPPSDLRTDEMTMRSMVLEEGFTFDHAIDAGKFHFGLAFKKQ